jgi:HEAT repeat protein
MTNPESENQISSIEMLLSSDDSVDFQSAVDSLRNLQGSARIDAITKLLADPSAQLALGAARAIGELECVEAGDLLINLVQEPGEWFGHEDRRAIRIASVMSLGQLKYRPAIEPLLELLDKGHDTDLQLEIIKTLGSIGCEESIGPLVRAVRSRSWMALSAAGALAQIGGESAFQALMSFLQYEEEIPRSAAVWALGEMGDERAIVPLMVLMGVADPLLRCDIAWAIGRIGGPFALTALSEILKSEADKVVRAEAEKSVKCAAENPARRN